MSTSNEAISGEKVAPLNPGGDVPPVLVHVTAPADLPAGYTFEAQMNGNPDRTFMAEVPEGGVTEGQTFLTAVPDSVDKTRLQVPTGDWKDGICGCFNAGLCHPSLCCAIWCPQILMAQVMTRMHLTWLGEPGPWVATQNTFKVVVAMVFCYLVYSTALEMAALPDQPRNVPMYITVLRTIGITSFTVWACYSLCRTRENVRARYSIPEKNCRGCEDCMCSFFCTCCAVAQLARHTGEYETYNATCCTTTGHVVGTPELV